ncbi:Uncharacterized protein APZ42_022653 [Daphnia magna]|uniref:Uncharacterized protein n=1 Tax=Daphnia magna TaxID=35525 RepID=A0A164VP32_9CRUS|nr:Uncharacterized protein APZ42_022653 [Daphnia magna]
MVMIEYGDLSHLTSAEYSSVVSTIDHPIISSFLLLPITQLACIGVNTIISFELDVFIFLLFKIAVSTNCFNITLSGPQATTLSSSSLRYKSTIRTLALLSSSFASSLSSSTPFPSPHRCLRLRLSPRHIAAFVSSFAASPSSRYLFVRPNGCSSAETPRRLRQFTVERHPGIVLFCFVLCCIVLCKLTRWLPPRLCPIFFVACRERALFCLMVYAMGGTVAAPFGAVGNAPVGTSLCRCGDRFLGCAFPEWFLSPCQPGLVFGQVPPCS